MAEPPFADLLRGKFYPNGKAADKKTCNISRLQIGGQNPVGLLARRLNLTHWQIDGRATNSPQRRTGSRNPARPSASLAQAGVRLDAEPVLRVAALPADRLVAEVAGPPGVALAGEGVVLYDISDHMKLKMENGPFTRSNTPEQPPLTQPDMGTQVWQSSPFQPSRQLIGTQGTVN